MPAFDVNLSIALSIITLLKQSSHSFLSFFAFLCFLLSSPFSCWIEHTWMIYDVSSLIDWSEEIVFVFNVIFVCHFQPMILMWLNIWSYVFVGIIIDEKSWLELSHVTSHFQFWCVWMCPSGLIIWAEQDAYLFHYIIGLMWAQFLSLCPIWISGTWNPLLRSSVTLIAKNKRTIGMVNGMKVL